MQIRKLEDFQKNKVKIFVEDVEENFEKYISENGYFCFLYKSEIYKYKLKEGVIIPEKILLNI